MNFQYRVYCHHPRTGASGLSLMPSEDGIAEETAWLESRGYVVTKVERPIEMLPDWLLTSQSGSRPR
jgi:hypothetical protein